LLYSQPGAAQSPSASSSGFLLGQSPVRSVAPDSANDDEE